MAKVATTPLPGLPLEILKNIAVHLDNPSANNLAIVNRACQEPAESKLWEKVTICDQGTLPLPSLNAESFSWSADNDQGQAAWPGHRAQQQSGAKNAVIQVLHLLQSAPWRAGLVRLLDIDLRYDCPSELIVLLRKLSGSLTHLSVRLPTSLILGFGPCEISSLFELFRRLDDNTHFRSLQHVKVDIRTQWSQTVHTILRLAPNLISLHIHSNPRQLANDSSSTFEPTQPLPTMYRLKEIIIDDVHETTVLAIADIVENAPNLERIALRDSYMRWKPSIHDPLVSALSRAQGLKSFEATSSVLRPLVEMRALQEVDNLTVLWSLDEMEAGGSTPIIPLLPNLKRYHIEMGLTAYLGSFVDLDSPALRQAIANRLIYNQLIDERDRAPHLSMISLPTSHGYSFSRPTQLIGLGETEWQSSHFEGLLVYSWVNGDDELVHTRVRRDSEFGVWVRGADTTATLCLEQALYNGEGIPLPVLTTAYAAAGIKITETTPARGMELPQKGWAILRQWQLLQ